MDLIWIEPLLMDLVWLLDTRRAIASLQCLMARISQMSPDQKPTPDLDSGLFDASNPIF
ncbi:hypothetical protein HPC62_12035 [Thermoleptolyngbya sichuanensis A183]|uniref:Uncharacterized protein n=1 Tax=Thermoleptolyngbya sichuanensis A183 TaxID=2737172 RepID=A0A6M8BEZ2_9CYAN|nr:hypothetical protein [Thermoleptolyngbya sichuanensis]QKD82820.1 hypothetical protein HPC62_12035 [Thermoleptolyngbya sichuanensis A183]